MKIKIPLIAILACLFPLAAEEIIHEEITVQGRIFSNEPGSKNMDVIERPDIERLQAADFSSLFAMLPALSVGRRGPGDSSFDLYLRGSQFEQVLVLVNGRPFANPQSGHFNTDFPFSLQDVERIEIIRGGSSTAYGAGAFAGVVNIILRPQTAFHLQAALAEHNTGSLYTSLGGKLGAMQISASFNREVSSGFYPGRELNQWRLTTQATYAKKTWQADLAAGYLDKNFGAAGFYAPYPSLENNHAAFYTLSAGRRSGNFHYGLAQSYSQHQDHFVLDRDRPAFHSADHTTRQWQLTLNAGYKDSYFSVDAGFDFCDDKMESTSMGRHVRDRASFYLNLLRSGKNSGIDGGLRLESNSAGKLHATFQSGIFYNIASKLQLKLSFSRSLRVPSFTELFYNAPGNSGNSGLQPEKSDNLELAATRLGGRSAFNLAVFYRRQTNTIDWIKYATTADWQAVNIAENDIAGCEIGGRTAIGQTAINAGLERLFALQRNDGFISKYGLRFPDVRIYAVLTSPLSRHLRALAAYSWKRIYHTAEKGHFLDIALEWHLARITLRAKCENLFDTRIEEIPGVKVAGRWFSLALIL